MPKYFGSRRTLCPKSVASVCPKSESRFGHWDPQMENFDSGFHILIAKIPRQFTCQILDLIGSQTWGGVLALFGSIRIRGIWHKMGVFGTTFQK